MGQGSRKAKLAALFVLGVALPALFFAAVEGALRLTGVDTEFVSLPGQQVQTPPGAVRDGNFFIAQDVYERILQSALPAEAAEWLSCFRAAPDVQYKLKPNGRFRVSNTVNRMELDAGLKILIESNRDGYRTRPLPRTKPPGVYRILFLGDSTTFGWGVERAERFSDRLGDWLNAASTGLRYDVVNLALPGYSSYHGRIVLERFRKLRAAEGSEPFVTLDEFRANLTSIIETGRKNGFETILLPPCCPLDYLSAQTAPAEREGIPALDGTYILLDAVSTIQRGRREPELARQYKTPYGKEVLESRRLLYVTSDTCHPNVLGHRILAEALFERIFRDRLNTRG